MKEKITLQFWTVPLAGFHTERMFNVEVRHFRKRHPRVTVNVTIIPWSRAWNRYMRMVTNRGETSVPDVMLLGNTWVPTLIYGDALREIPRPRAGTYIPQLLESGMHQGRLYALPWYTDLRVLYYRRDILARCGIAPDSLGTFTGLRAACRRLQDERKRDFFPFSLSGQKESILIHDLAPWIWGEGGDIFSPDAKRVTLMDRRTQAGLHFYFDLIDRGCVPIQGRDLARFTGNFFTGDCAMQITGTLPVKTLFNPRHRDYQARVARNYAIAPFPRGSKAQATYIGGGHLAVSSASEHPEEANEFIRFLAAPETQMRFLKQLGLLPSRPDCFARFFGGHHEAGEVFRRSLPFARSLPPVVALGSIEQSFVNFSTNMLGILRRRRYGTAALRRELEQLDAEIQYIRMMLL